MELDGHLIGERLQADTGSGSGAVDVQVADDILREVEHFVEVALSEAVGRVESKNDIDRVAFWETEVVFSEVFSDNTTGYFLGSVAFVDIRCFVPNRTWQYGVIFRMHTFTCYFTNQTMHFIWTGKISTQRNYVKINHGVKPLHYNLFEIVDLS